MTVPLCRCRVLYIGSAVPTITKDGLQGIQQPLRERYPVDQNTETKGIDSWLSVWSNGLLLEYIDGSKKTESAFFPIVTLHYCAAVRYVNVSGFSVEGGGERFIPLDTPFANIPDSPHPPIFAAIFRRTSGVKVLECHAFICTNERAANALVRCCFHAYADTIYLKMDDKIPGLKAIKEASRSATPSTDQNFSEEHENGHLEEPPRDEIDWNERAIGQKTWQRRQQSGEYETASISSSLFKKSPKKGKKKKAPSEGDGVLVPYTGENGFRHRRAGSQPEIAHTEEQGHPFFVPPMPFGPPMMNRPPFGRPMMMPPPPPHWRPPPPHLAHRMPPPHPMFMPPPHLMHPPPPHMMRFPFYPPHPMFHPRFMPPPPPHMFYPPSDRPRSPNDGPIITGPESVYDTFPRRNYEEPIYMPSSQNGVPQSSYKPGSHSPEHYEGYYETYRQSRPEKKRNASRSDSDESQSDFWEAYEAGIYKRSHLNERAFAGALARSKTNEPTTTEGRGSATASPRVASRGVIERNTPMQNERPLDRPISPPADYDLDNLHLNDPSNKKTTTVQPTFSERAVF